MGECFTYSLGGVEVHDQNGFSDDSVVEAELGKETLPEGPE